MKLDPITVPAFPNVPRGLLGDNPEPDLVERFLFEARVWRDQVSLWLNGVERAAYLSDRLCQILTWTLGEAASPGEATLPYRLEVFPGAPSSVVASPAFREDRNRWALDILVWRSGVVDYLADVWDVIGPDALDPRDCANAETLFMPRPTHDLCIDCLQPLARKDRAAVNEHFNSCVIRLRRMQSDQVAGAPWTVGNPWES